MLTVASDSHGFLKGYRAKLTPCLTLFSWHSFGTLHYVTLGISAFAKVLERNAHLYCYYCTAQPFISLAFSKVAVCLHFNKVYIFVSENTQRSITTSYG